MLLRKSISGTKKFFQKTLGGLKSLFSKGNIYEKLPKSSPQNNAFSYSTAAIADVNHVHANYKDLDKLYTELAQQYWGNNIQVADHQSKEKKITTTTTTSTSTPTKQDDREFQSGNLKQELAHNKSSPVKVMKNMETQRRSEVVYEYPNHNIKVMKKKKNREEDDEMVGRSWLVEEKLKELEMLDISNVDHVLDIEEVLHYYSRLTCPAYLEIVDNFFLNIYAEFFKPPPTPAATGINSSRLRPRTSLLNRTSY